MKEYKLITILSASVLAVIFFALLTPVWGQNTSASQSALSGQSSGLFTQAPLNPEWLAFEKNRTEGKPMVTTTASGKSLGYGPSPVDLSYLKGKEVSRPAQIQAYPASYDLRTIGKVTSVKDQGVYNTCWAFATYGSLESYLLPAENWDFSEYNLATQSGFDFPWYEKGNAFMSTAYLARWNGPVNEADDPYPADEARLSNGISCGNACPIQKHSQDVYFFPERFSSSDNNNIKLGLTTYGALCVLMHWDDAYYSTSPATYYNPVNNSSNHLVAIVGWDDNYPRTNFHGSAGAPPGNGAFIMKNSWGPSWGDGGYFYLSYYDISLQTSTAFTAEPVSNYASVYQYDPLGWVSSGGYDNPIAWGANIFIADVSANPLTAVGFYTNDLNTQYEVYIYTSPTSGPLGGTQYVGPQGTMPLAGYHTVKLASPVPLTAGQLFSVVIKLTTSGYGFPLAHEYAVPGYSSAATASPGQSYVSGDGSTWDDITIYEPTANLCIKAFACGPSKIGVFRNGPWYLDYNGNRVWDPASGDVSFWFGTSGDLPVSGDWRGIGQDQIGVFRNGPWYLDYNGDNVWDPDSGDLSFWFGTTGDQPVAGDWNGDGKDEIGVFRNGPWYLDYNGNRIWDPDSGDVSFWFGTSGDLPVSGDWNGDGKDEIGVFRNGPWYLDYNGNRVWDPASGDVSFWFGTTGDQPVAGDWNCDGKDEIGVFRNGPWYLDTNGNRVWDPASGDVSFWLGTIGDRPIAGRWGVDWLPCV